MGIRRGVLAVVGAAVGVVALIGAVVLLGGAGDPTSDPPDVEVRQSSGWSRSLEDESWGIAAVGENVCSTSGRELFCVDAATGEERFVKALPGVVATPPTLVGETLVVALDYGTPGGGLQGYAADGSLTWEEPPQPDLVVDATVLARRALPAAGTVVAVPVGDFGLEGLRGVDATTGQELWRAFEDQPGGAPFGATGGGAVSDGQRFYVETFTAQDVDGDPLDRIPTVVALDPASGAELWRMPLNRDVPGGTELDSAVPLAAGSAVGLTIGGDSAQVVVADVATGVVHWQVAMEVRRANVAELDGVTVVSSGTSFHGYDAAGTEIWVTQAAGATSQLVEMYGYELVVADGALYAFRADVLHVDPSTGASERLHGNNFANDIAVVADVLVAVGENVEGISLSA